MNNDTMRKLKPPDQHGSFLQTNLIYCEREGIGAARDHTYS
jgi:hypothetical protein